MFTYLYSMQRSMLGWEGLASRLSPALQINQHLSRNLCFRSHSSYKSECQHSLVNPNIFFCPYISAKLQLKWQWSPELINPLIKLTPILSFLTCRNSQCVLLKKKKKSVYLIDHTQLPICRSWLDQMGDCIWKASYVFVLSKMLAVISTLVTSSSFSSSLHLFACLCFD